jgi:predicted transcriptional regulator
LVRPIDREPEIVAAIERGLEDMKSGRVVPHEDVMADIDATIEKAKSMKRKR